MILKNKKMIDGVCFVKKMRAMDTSTVNTVTENLQRFEASNNVK